MTTLLPVAPLGVQLPRLASNPPFFTSAGEDAADLAAAAGLQLDPWQKYVLEVALGERTDGRWSAFEICLLVPRQNGKGAVIEALELAHLFLFGARVILHSAHQFKTAKDGYRRIRDLVRGTPDLHEQVANYRSSNEETGIELVDGARLSFVARSGGSGRGMSGDLIVFDEAFNLSGDLVADMIPTLSARPNPQVWYTSSAGMPDSETLARVRERGIAGEKRLTLFDWSADDDAELDDQEAWKQANPGLGIRLDPEFIQLVERATMGDVEFARERLGIWHDPRRGSVISEAEWERCSDEHSEALDPVVLAVDVTPDRAMSSLAIAGKRTDGLAHVEVIANRRGTDWVVSAIQEVVSRFDVSTVVVDKGGPAGSLVPELMDSGTPLTVTTSSELAAACGAFYDAVMARQLRHKPSLVLSTALAAAKKRSLMEAWAWARKDSAVDISPLVAVTLAHHGLAVAKPKKERSRRAIFV